MQYIAVCNAFPETCWMEYFSLIRPENSVNISVWVWIILRTCQPFHWVWQGGGTLVTVVPLSITTKTCHFFCYTDRFRVRSSSTSLTFLAKTCTIAQRGSAGNFLRGASLATKLTHLTKRSCRWHWKPQLKEVPNQRKHQVIFVSAQFVPQW